MASETEIVEEFRGIVESVIRNQVEQAQTGPLRRSWPDYDKIAKAADLTFVSVNHRDGRPSVIGLGSEHAWGVHTERLRYSNRAGFLAVVSEVEKPDVLTRRWAFDSAMQMISVDTEKYIMDPVELQASVEWIKSPHLHPETLGKLALLDPNEEAEITPKLLRLAEDQAKLSDDLAALARARHSPLPNNFLIN